MIEKFRIYARTGLHHDAARAYDSVLFSYGRFLQAEAGPWGHLSPSPRSPTRTPSLSPGAASSSSHLSANASPSGPSPTSPSSSTGLASGIRGGAGPKQYRSRTSSMPAVPRHRVRIYGIKNRPPEIFSKENLHGKNRIC